MLYKSDPQILSKVIDLARYTGISYVVAWGGTFIINLIRAPKLLHDDAIKEPHSISIDPLEARREAIIKQFIEECGAGNPKAFLEWLLNHRDVTEANITAKLPEFMLPDDTIHRALDLGILSRRLERQPYGWARTGDTRAVYFYSVAPQFEAAIARVIYKQ